MTGRFLFSLLLVLSVAATVSTKPPEVTASWREVDIAVDGNDAEWPDGATLLTEAPIAVGVTNDAEFAYVRVRTSDRAAGMKLLYGGLTVWLDPAGGDKKVFGIKYPVGAPLPSPGRGRRDRGGSEDSPEDDAPPRGRPDIGEVQAREQGSRPPAVDPSTVVPRRVELIGPKKGDARSLVLDALPPGFAVGINRLESALVYELKVPLARSADNPYGIGAPAGALVGLGLETGKLQPPQMTDRGPGGMRGPGGPGGGMGGPGGGMGPPGGLGPGGRSGGAGGPDADLFKSTIKAWTRVRLASAR